MSTTLELSEATYQLLADLAQHQQRPLEEMLRICLLAYEERCYQQAHQQMLAEGLLLPLPTPDQLAADEEFEPEPIPGTPLSAIILEDRRSCRWSLWTPVPSRVSVSGAPGRLGRPAEEAGARRERATGGTHMHKAASTLFADEIADLKQEVARIVADPEVWLHTPNAHLGGESPINLIGTPKEQRLRDLIRAIKHGMVP